MERTQRLGYVDGLRALAALYVVMSHLDQQVWVLHHPTGWALTLVETFYFGHQAVSVFIVLSGFSLMLPVARRQNHVPQGIWRFYLRRARRILPPYYLAMAFSLLLIWLWLDQKTGTAWDGSFPVTWSAVVTHLLLVQNFSATEHGKINPVLWSVAMECQIYLFFPLLVLLWRRYHPLFNAVVVAALSLALMNILAVTWVGRVPSYGMFAFVPQYFGLFAFGMLAASVYTTGMWPRLTRWYAWEILGLGGLALLGFLANSAPIFLLDLMTGVMTIGFLLAASRPGRVNPVRAVLEWRPLVWIGGFSYSLYLIHEPLLQLLWQYGLRPLGLSDTITYLALLLVGGPLIIAAAWGFYWLCERPFLNGQKTAHKVAPSQPGKTGRRARVFGMSLIQARWRWRPRFGVARSADAAARP